MEDVKWSMRIEWTQRDWMTCVRDGRHGWTDADSDTQSSVKNVFIRGSVVRYVHLPAASVDTPLLEDATRRGMFPGDGVFIQY